MRREEAPRGDESTREYAMLFHRCVCPRCGCESPRRAQVPCIATVCPSCGAKMRPAETSDARVIP